jgi:hypothetical protein
MAARSFDSAYRGVPRVHQFARPAALVALGPPLRYRLVVIAPSMVEVVRCAGGWLFDQGMAGWDVTVLTADQADARPLQILGAAAADLEAALTSPVQGPSPQAIAVRADLYDSDARVHRMVREGLHDGPAEVRLWGGPWPEDLDGPVGPVRHQLSMAARAFKAQALAALGAQADPGEATEVFRRGEIRRPSTVPAP